MSVLARIISSDAGGIPTDGPVAAQRPAIDTVLLSKVLAHSDPLAFLVGTYSRAMSAGGEYGAYVQQQCIAYSAMVLLQPAQFSEVSAPKEGEGARRVLEMIREEGKLTMPKNFLGALLSYMAGLSMPGYGPEGAVGAFATRSGDSMLAQLIKDMQSTTLVDMFNPHYVALAELVTHKAFLPALAASKLFDVTVTSCSAQQIEILSALGPFFRVSCIPEKQADPMTGELLAVRHPVGVACFSETAGRSKGDVDIQVENVRVMLRSVQNYLVTVVKALLKDQATQEKLFNWFGVVMELNQIRTKDGFHMGFVAQRSSSSNGFLFNTLAVLVKMCKPFMNPDDPKMQKIDATFLISKHRFDLSKETRVASSQDEVESWIDIRNEARMQQYRQAQASAAALPAGAAGETSPTAQAHPEDGTELKVSESFGTISELFFLTLRCIHIVGPVRILRDYHKLGNQTYALGQQMQAAALTDPDERARLEGEVNELLERRHCYDVVMADVAFLEDLLHFARLAARWLLRLADAPPTIIPLPTPPSRVFMSVPELCVEAVLDVIKFVASMQPSVLETLAVPVLHDYLNFFMAFSSSLPHIKSPHLRGKLLEVMSLLIPKGRNQGFEYGGGNLSSLFQDHETSIRCLIPTLVQFYIDIEITGSHGQFYEKFQYRHYMAELLLYVSQFPPYLEAIEKESANTEKFVRFVNMMLNDTIYFVDEALMALAKIRQIEQDKADPTVWNAKTQEEKEAADKQLDQSGDSARGSLQQSNQILEMMKMLTSKASVPFLREELIDRVAAMLNYVIKEIAGPKCIQLKVSNPEKYNFRPKQLLALVCEVFMNLARHEEFGRAVVRDGRSYDQQVLMKVSGLLRNHALKDVDFVDGFVKFCETLKSHKDDEMELEDMLGDIPDEFCDPITTELMKDPVKLPTSGAVCDRGMITRCLLSDEIDPFNRQRLTVDMLVPQPELKAQIDAFLAERKRKGGKPEA